MSTRLGPASSRSRGIKLFRQDESGAVTLRFYRRSLGGSPFTLLGTFREQPVDESGVPTRQIELRTFSRGSSCRRISSSTRRKISGLHCERLHPGEIGRVIGRQAQQPLPVPRCGSIARRKFDVQVRRTMMAPLRPWIRKHQVANFDRSGRNQAG